MKALKSVGLVASRVQSRYARVVNPASDARLRRQGGVEDDGEARLKADRALPGRAAALVAEVVVALSHGGLAWVLGALARILGGAPGPAVNATAMTPMSRSALGRLVELTIGAPSPVTLAVVGLLLVVTRGAGSTLLLAHEVRAGARAAGQARLDVLRAAMRGPQSAPTLGAAIAWPAAIELGVRAARGRRRAWVQLVVLAAVVVALDPWLAALLVALVAPFGVALRPVRRALRGLHREATRGVSETIDAVRDVVEHAALWATCGAELAATRRVAAYNDEGRDLSVRSAAGQSLASASNETMAALAVVVLVAAFATGPNGVRPTLVPILVALVSAYRPIRDLAEAGGAIARGEEASARVAQLALPRPPSTPARTWTSASLALLEVTLEVGGEAVRAGLDLELRASTITALVGAPGTGKSALLESIAGVRRLARGEIRFGDERIDDAGIGPAHRPIAWVPPSPPVLPGTLAENLVPDAPDDRTRVERARSLLRELGDEILGALDDGALLGPRGRRPSSGEAQRIALARALATDAPVLLLDEPTANLDARGEALAIAAIARHGRGRVVLLATHRPAPLTIADRVIALDAPSEPAVSLVGVKAS